MNFSKLLFMFIFFALFQFIINAEESINYQVFSRKHIAWADSGKVKSRKAGYKNANQESPAEIWFKPVPKTNEKYAVCLKPLTVGNYDYLLLKYKVMPDTYFTMDVWWDKGKQKRPLSYIKGNGEWKVLKLPVAGKTVKVIFAISGKAKAETTRKVYIDYFKAVKEGSSLNVILYKIQNPILIPEPKIYKLSKQKIVLIKDNRVDISVCLNKKELPLKNIIVKEIAEDFKIPVKSISADNSAKTIINFEFGKECKIPVPEKKEAYAIKFSKSNNQNIITLAAQDKAGLYWAWKTLRQLTEKNNGVITINVCDIVDWPYYQYRGTNAYNLKQEKLNLNFKYNYSVLPWWTEKNCMVKLSRKYIDNLKVMCNYAVARGTNVVQWLGPFLKKNSITVSDDKQIDKLFKLYEISLKTGNRACYLSINDGGRYQNSFTPADQKAYNNDRLLSHAYFTKKMSDKIFAKYPDTEVMVCTKDYESAKGVRGYYDRIGVSKNAVIMWTGAQCVTHDYHEDVIKKI